jgi:hypothetical protein
MPAPTQSNSAYKKRLISAMLEEPAFHEISHRVSNSPPTWSLKVISSVVGLSVFSALGVFLVLYHHDSSAASPSGTIPAVVAALEGQGKTGSKVADPAAHKAINSEVARAEKSGPAAVSPADMSAAKVAGIPVREAIEFKLKRSRTYQTVGAIGLRLLRVNPRRRTCDVSVQVKNRHSLQRRVQLNRPLELKPTPSADSLQLTVSAISRDSIAGSLSPLRAAVTAPQQ